MGGFEPSLAYSRELDQLAVSWVEDDLKQAGRSASSSNRIVRTRLAARQLTPAQVGVVIGTAQPTSGPGAAPVAAAAPDAPAAGAKHLDQHLLMGVLIWLALPLVALGYGLWHWWRKPS